MITEIGISNHGYCLSKPEGSTKTEVETYKGALLQYAKLLLIIINAPKYFQALLNFLGV